MVQYCASIIVIMTREVIICGAFHTYQSSCVIGVPFHTDQSHGLIGVPYWPTFLCVPYRPIFWSDGCSITTSLVVWLLLFPRYTYIIKWCWHNLLIKKIRERNFRKLMKRLGEKFFFYGQKFIFRNYFAKNLWNNAVVANLYNIYTIYCICKFSLPIFLQVYK